MEPPASPSGDDSPLTESTACWRRYVATWEIKAGRLYLRGVTGRYQLNSTEPLFADWVSDVLWVPHGELLQYVHMGFDSLYEFDMVISVSDGIVVDFEVFDNRAGRGRPAR